MNKDRINKLQVIVLFLLFAILYLPYVFHGGFVADDLPTFFTIPENTSYIAFQRNFSSSLVMTARPVSALLHGLATWFFDATPWKFHLLNLSLFFLSILLFYAAIKTLVSSELAFLFAVLSLVYPSSSATTFTSIMLNSNLAGTFFAAALLISTYELRLGSILIGVMLGLSALSYEAFIPLFLFIPILGLTSNGFNFKDRKFLKNSIGVVIGLLIYFFYKKYLENYFFHASFNRVYIFSYSEFFKRIIPLYLNAYKVFFEDSFSLSVNSLKILSNKYYLLAPIIFISIFYSILLSWGFPASIFSALWKRSSFKKEHSFAGLKKDWKFYLKYLLPIFLLLLASYSLYLFSHYQPNSSGFSNRTLGGIRFTSALFIAFLVVFIGSFLRSKLRIVLFVGLVSVLIVFLSFSIIGQRQAWVAADKANQKIISDFRVAMSANSIEVADRLTTLFIMPDKFPQSVNDEPLLGSTWEVIPALSQYYKNSEINGMAVAKSNLNLLGLKDDELEIPIYWNASLSGMLIFDHGEFDSDGKIIKISNTNDFKKFMLSKGYPEDRTGQSMLTKNAVLSFSRTLKEPQKYLVEGWGSPESWGVWSVGKKAILELNIGALNAAKLSFQARAYVTKDKPIQAVEIYVDGEYLKKIFLTQYDLNQISVPLPKSYKSSSKVKIEFRIPDASSPQELGMGDDIRQLGIGLIDMVIE